MKKNILLLVALLGAMVWTGCENLEEPVINDNSGTRTCWTLTVEANINADTKALSLDENTLTAYWKKTEIVKVYKGASSIGTLSVTPDSQNNKKATLTGTLNVSGISLDDELMLIIPNVEGDTWSYLGQNGTLKTVSEQYDIATAKVKVTDVNTEAGTLETEVARFNNEQSIYRFGFKEKTGDVLATTNIKVSRFILSSSVNKLVQTVSYNGQWASSAWGELTVKPSSATDDFLYVALRHDGSTTDDAFHFMVFDKDGALYQGDKTIPSAYLENAKFLSAKNVAVSKATVQQGTQNVATEVW